MLGFRVSLRSNFSTTFFLLLLSRFLHFIAGGCFYLDCACRIRSPILIHFPRFFFCYFETEVKNVQFQHWVLVFILKPTLNTPKYHVKANNRTKRTTSNAMIKWVRAQVHTHRYIDRQPTGGNTRITNKEVKWSINL